MLRKMVVIATVIAMPMTLVGVAAISGSGVAGAAKGPNGPITCTVTANVNFAKPGLSYGGSVSTKPTSKTETADEVLATPAGDPTCAGSGKSLKISSANTLCTGTGEPSSNPNCKLGKKAEYGYDSWSDYTSGGLSSLSSITSLAFTINKIKYTIGDLSSSAAFCDSGTYGEEVGFTFTGSVTKPSADAGQSAALTACLGAVVGSPAVGTQTFAAQLEANSSSPGNGETVSSAIVDPSTSTIAIDGGS